ncbi:MAG: replication initiation protein [Pseudomonadota bacterium]
MSTDHSSDGKVFTLHTRPRRDEAYKPSELIQISGHQALSLNARRAITVLWHNAHLSGVAAGKDYVIEIDDLKPDTHKGYEMVEEAIEALMTSILVLKMANGKTRRVQFLGGNDLDDPDRPAGCLTYSFDKRLVEILQDSAIWGKINIPVLMAFSSKYAITLYENIAQRTGLRKSFEDFELDAFRTLLGVEDGKYPMFGALNKHVIKPAVAEVNALAPFSVSVLPVKTGKRVSGVKIAWYQKDRDEAAAAWAEVGRHKVGRKARITGSVQHVLDPVPSVSRLSRAVRETRD